MSGHTVIHPGPGVSQKAHVASAMASITKLRIVEHRETLAKTLFEGRRRIWVNEEAARDGKRRTLIDDNPTSG